VRLSVSGISTTTIKARHFSFQWPPGASAQLLCPKPKWSLSHEAHRNPSILNGMQRWVSTSLACPAKGLIPYLGKNPSPGRETVRKHGAVKWGFATPASEARPKVMWGRKVLTFAKGLVLHSQFVRDTGQTAGYYRQSGDRSARRGEVRRIYCDVCPQMFRHTTHRFPICRARATRHIGTSGSLTLITGNPRAVEGTRIRSG